MKAHWYRFEECREVADGLRVLDWETLSPVERRRSGLVAKWTLQRAFEAAVMLQGKPLPPDSSLSNLARAAGIGLGSAQIDLLGRIDEEVTAAEIEDSDLLSIHEQACAYARGLIACIDQSLLLGAMRGPS